MQVLDRLIEFGLSRAFCGVKWMIGFPVYVLEYVSSILRAASIFGFKMRLIEVTLDREDHPLDVIEMVAHENEWAFERSGDNEIAIAVGGRWSQYTVSYSWMEDCEALHLACAFDMKVARGRSAEVLKLITLINEQLLMGHFDFWQRDNVIMFRQSLILAGGLDPTERQIEVLLSSAVEACETYYSAFQFVVWSGQPAKLALDTALFETVGTA
jgi:hypothetical protein